MVPAGSDRVSRARPYSGTSEVRLNCFGYGAFTLCGVQFHALRLRLNLVTHRPAGRRINSSPTTLVRQRLPSWHRTSLGSSLFARHYSGSRGFFPFLWVLRCFSSPACLPHPMYSDADPSALPLVGFPIRRSRGQRLVSTSPGLIAAAHVLLRLLAPRHPPCALILLIVKNS